MFFRKTRITYITSKQTSVCLKKKKKNNPKKATGIRLSGNEKLKTAPSRTRRHDENGSGGGGGVRRMRYFRHAVVSECPPGVNRTCTGTGPVLRNRTIVGRVPFHRNTGICTWAWKRTHKNTRIIIILL